MNTSTRINGTLHEDQYKNKGTLHEYQYKNNGYFTWIPMQE